MSLPDSFRVYKQKVNVTINGKEEEFELLPLSGQYYGDFMDIMKIMPSGEDDGGNFMDNFSPEITNKIHMLLMQTFKESLGIVDDRDISDLDKTISKNFINLIPVLATVNLPKVADDKDIATDE